MRELKSSVQEKHQWKKDLKLLVNANIVAMHCGIYNIGRSKIYDDNNSKR
jgi:hypothetical protein